MARARAPWGRAACPLPLTEASLSGGPSSRAPPGGASGPAPGRDAQKGLGHRCPLRGGDQTRMTDSGTSHMGTRRGAEVGQGAWPPGSPLCEPGSQGAEPGGFAGRRPGGREGLCSPRRDSAWSSVQGSSASGTQQSGQAAGHVYSGACTEQTGRAPPHRPSGAGPGARVDAAAPGAGVEGLTACGDSRSPAEVWWGDLGQVRGTAPATHGECRGHAEAGQAGAHRQGGPQVGAVGGAECCCCHGHLGLQKRPGGGDTGGQGRGGPDTSRGAPGAPLCPAPPTAPSECSHHLRSAGRWAVTHVVMAGGPGWCPPTLKHSPAQPDPAPPLAPRAEPPSPRAEPTIPCWPPAPPTRQEASPCSRAWRYPHPERRPSCRGATARAQEGRGEVPWELPPSTTPTATATARAAREWGFPAQGISPQNPQGRPWGPSCQAPQREALGSGPQDHRGPKAS